VIENVTTHQQYVEEVIPAQTTVVCYQTQNGYCQNCQRRVESRHPQQVPHRLIGPRALLIAAELKHAMGVPYRKVATVLKRLCGLSITAGALTQSMQSLAKWISIALAIHSFDGSLPNIKQFKPDCDRVIAPMSMKPAGG
jgi:hypothetical protein